MTGTGLYEDIAMRTGGDIYIGVVGPVRTGKSTFIKRFCETLVIPNMPADSSRERITDELPQSSAGRTIMTTEPKFIPEKAAALSFEKNLRINVRLVDCVGYIVPSSLGYIEEDEPRMVKTPWFDDEIPFNMAAEIGTKKVITEHSTIGIVVTTDGSISEIPREEYEEAEERVIAELKDINKPFVILLNSTEPESEQVQELSRKMRSKYGVPVIPVSCPELTEDEIKQILTEVLYEFPLRKVSVKYPAWLKSINNDDVKNGILEAVRNAAEGMRKLADVSAFAEKLGLGDIFSCVASENILPGTGTAIIKADMDPALYYQSVSDIAGETIKDESGLIECIRALKETERKYKKIEPALEQVNSVGYGIVMPSVDELSLEEPEIVKQGSRYGVRLKASAPSVHLMRADIKTEVAPIVGSEKQSEDLVKYLLDGFEEDPSKIWQSNIFGKSLDDLVNEGLKTKLMHMPGEARMKIQQTLERVINEGCNGLICIII